MNDMRENEVSSTVDWLSYTIRWERLRKNDWQTHDGQQVAVSRLLSFADGWKRDIPLHGYEDCWVSTDAGHARVMVSRPGHAMGVHVQLPGQALALLGVPQSLATCREMEGKVTRIDIAVDVRGQSDAADIYGALLSKSAVTRAAKHSLMVGNTGKTVYVGSRASERFLRVYDKAAQTETEGNWTRIEMECKGRVARWVFGQVSAEGNKSVGSLIKAFVACPTIDWYDDALSREAMDIGKPQPKKMTDTRAWLLGTVAATLARETTDDADFLTEFLLKMQSLRRDGGADVE